MPRGAPKDLKDQRFGRLVAIELTPPPRKISGRCLWWLCQCDCGVKTAIRSSCLIRGDTQSCGCFQRENMSVRTKTHGATRTPEFQAWAAMVERCHKETAKTYHHYGERGIYVCPHWRGENGFANFRHDMGYRPSPDLSLDRKDNNGHYTCGHCEFCITNNQPANCRWATRPQQIANRRNTRNLTFQGETHMASIWATAMKIPPRTIYKRIALGWTDDEILADPRTEGWRERLASIIASQAPTSC